MSQLLCFQIGLPVNTPEKAVAAAGPSTWAPAPVYQSGRQLLAPCSGLAHPCLVLLPGAQTGGQEVFLCHSTFQIGIFLKWYLQLGELAGRRRPQVYTTCWKSGSCLCRYRGQMVGVSGCQRGVSGHTRYHRMPMAGPGQPQGMAHTPLSVAEAPSHTTACQQLPCNPTQVLP